MAYPPEFDELHVVSDLHMGGRRSAQGNFQIFNRGQRLGALIRELATRRKRDEVALVVNGDVFDSLAEEEVDGYAALDVPTLKRMMEHLWEDESFRPVWQAFAEFVQTPRRHLFLVIGNHDIELALPYVQDFLRDGLSGGKGDARSRVNFAAYGQGVACKVGGARVFCTHGNELDPWNLVDYNRLGQLANAMSAGRAIERRRWEPNAGTRLVVDVMNSIKRRFPFVDVLKPETASVFAVLLALDKEAFEGVDLSQAFPILRDKRRGKEFVEDLLGAQMVDPAQVSVDEALVELLGPQLRREVQRQATGNAAQSEETLLLSAETNLADGRSAELEASGDGQETLGVFDLVKAKLGLVSKADGLRRALQDWLKEDATFDVTNDKDELFQAIQPRVGGEVDFTVTGHTHLARALEMGGGGYYYNAGTWIRTLQLTSQVLADPKAFEDKVWAAFLQGGLKALDDAKIPGPKGTVPLLLDRTNVVRISAGRNRVVGELFQVQDAPGGAVALVREPDTKPFILS